jgi:hypothetical protein
MFLARIWKYKYLKQSTTQLFVEKRQKQVRLFRDLGW